MASKFTTTRFFYLSCRLTLQNKVNFTFVNREKNHSVREENGFRRLLNVFSRYFQFTLKSVDVIYLEVSKKSLITLYNFLNGDL